MRHYSYGAICLRLFWCSRRVIIIGSDGLWDVIGADEAVTKALASHDKGQNPAQMLSDYALWRHEVSDFYLLRCFNCVEI